MAMEGPTPVSALIHAATMVTAGVYLLIRSSPLIEYSPTVLLLCLWVGAITTVFSSLIGLFQQDIKKVIAYSTMSQLGIMVIAVGLSSYHVALFHLVNHAFYKALLFLGAGSVIHAVLDNQDFRKYGALKQFLPLSYCIMLIASLSLMAFPYMTGFFSKDFILESSLGQFHLSSVVVYYIATIGAMFTTLYSTKTLYLTFITCANGSSINYKKVNENNLYMSLPLVILAIFSIFFGFVTKDLFIGMGSNLSMDNSVYIHPINEIMLNTEFAVPTTYKLAPFIFTMLLIIISLIVSGYLFKTLLTFKLNKFGYIIYSFFNLRFLIELLYNKYITENILKLGGQTTKIIDKGTVEYVGPYGLQTVLVNLSKNLSTIDTGVVTSYALYILVAGLSYLCISYLPLITSYAFIIILLNLINFINSYLVDTSLPTNLGYLKNLGSLLALTNPPKAHAFISLPLQSNISSWFNKKNLKNLIRRALAIFFTGLALRSLILYLFDTNSFLHPFVTISLIYYAFYLLFFAIQSELYPMEVPMEVSMLQDTNTKKNSGILAMNSSNSATGSAGCSGTTGGAAGSNGAAGTSADNPIIPSGSSGQNLTQPAGPSTSCISEITNLRYLRCNNNLFITFKNSKEETIIRRSVAGTGFLVSRGRNENARQTSQHQSPWRKNLRPPIDPFHGILTRIHNFETNQRAQESLWL